MKGLNIKRIAAIGLGAALVGSALAPVVSAANVVPTGLSELGRSDVITMTGAPAVDIVVGANAAVSDVVWAGNIAARVAQLATKPVTCTADAGTVDLTVGGTVSTSGEGQVKEVAVTNLVKGGAIDFSGMNVTSIKMPSLVNNNASEWKLDDVTTKVDVEESLSTT
ncbi:MAG TPA: S-layer protein, partial [archaeon]|nr:S-layer protein [archaeon]